MPTSGPQEDQRWALAPVCDTARVRTHPATVVAHGDLTAEVDLELAPLVLETWRAGITTIHSCQDVGENLAGLAVDLPHLADVVRREAGRASIGFAGLDGLLAFLDALANAGPRDGFYERIAHWASPDAWQLALGTRDVGLEVDTDDRRGGLAPDGTPWSRFAALSFQVRFPRSDVGEMTDRMGHHSRGEAAALGRPTWVAITVPDDEPAGGRTPPG